MWILGVLCVMGVLVTDVWSRINIPILFDDNSVPSNEIPVSKLSDYLSTEEGLNFLKEEFHSIRGGQRRPWVVATSPENIGKNRYDDLVAYDDTRVVLKKIPDDPNSDYINANYIDGYNRPREYVATQGPMPNTVNDFWRMIWQLRARKIVMLANIMEHGKPKVEKYWPETNASYGDIIVTKLSEHELPEVEHVVRTFSIRKQGEPKRRIVKQFHFTGWPDFGVPADRLSIIALLSQARKYRPHDTVPIVVHCSAGIGRTGTVIMTDSMIQRAKTEQRVDFPKRLNSMRKQRPDVVEKEGQYIFAHEAIYDLFYNNETEDYLKRVENSYNKMDAQYEGAPADMTEALQRMKHHTTSLHRLIEDMVILNSEKIALEEVH